MDSHYETIRTPATAEYVFQVIQATYRLSWELEHECEPEIILTMDSTIKECWEGFDLVDWNPFNQSFNEMFGIQIDKAEWKSVLEPASEKTLRGVCDRIANEIFQEQIKPVSIMGKSCLKGGIFLTIRSKLAEAGASVEQLSPSSDLAPFAKNYLRAFLEISSKLFPGKFPKITVHRPLSDLSFGGVILSFLALVVGGIMEKFVLQDLGAFLFLLGAVGACVCFLSSFVVAAIPPKSVEFGNLKTFRDLVNFISEPQTTGA